MRKLQPIFLHDKNADVGVGTMIVFIAMVLVAGIAAAVLVQTANRLEIQAMQTGEQTKGEVATGLRIIDVEGEYCTRNVSTTTSPLVYSRIHNMTITIGPRAGSMDVDLHEAVLEISNSTVKCLLTYDGTSFASAVSNNGIFGTTNLFSDLAAYEFGIVVLEDADSSCGITRPVINRGDKVILSVNLSACFNGLAERTDTWGQIIPEEGSSGYFAFRTPASYTNTVYELY